MDVNTRRSQVLQLASRATDGEAGFDGLSIGHLGEL